MPAQDRSRGNQAMAAQCPGQSPDEGGEHGPVRPVQAGSRVDATEYGDLVDSTRSSTSLVEDVRPISWTNPSTCRKIKYSRRSDNAGIMSDQRSSLVSDPSPTSGTPQVIT